jgi:hypothetical protein
MGGNMKTLSVIATVVGVIGLVLACLSVLINKTILTLTPAGYLRGATAVFLLALVLAVYSGCWCSCHTEAKKKK